MSALLFVACSEQSTQSETDSSSSSKPLQSSGIQSSSSSVVSQSSGTQSASSASVSSPDTLFTTRTPTSKALTCSGPHSVLDTFEQSDWVCSMDYKDIHGYFYMQNTPTSCVEIMSTTPQYTNDTAELYLNGSLQSISPASYDFGGNHHNDYIKFTYQGYVFHYYHSSFGFGWRSCQPMDCMQVYESDDSTLVEDGCTSERTLPVVCRMANSDGSFDSFADNFTKCIGDQ